MNIAGLNHIVEFMRKHADSRSWLEAWVAEVREAKWESSVNIRARYSTASFLADNVVIFNVRGNRYRMEVKVAYNTNKVKIQWIGTHAEYDRRYGTGGKDG